MRISPGASTTARFCATAPYIAVFSELRSRERMIAAIYIIAEWMLILNSSISTDCCLCSGVVKSTDINRECKTYAQTLQMTMMIAGRRLNTDDTATDSGEFHFSLAVYLIDALLTPFCMEGIRRAGSQLVGACAIEATHEQIAVDESVGGVEDEWQ